MSLDSVLDRFAICNAEWNSAGMVSRLQPTKPADENSLPLVYMRPMNMTQPVARGSAGKYEVYRRFMLVIIVGTISGASFDDSDEGSQLLSDVSALLDAPIDYFMRHPRLDTDAQLAGTVSNQGELALVDDLTIQDNGPEMFQAIDGRMYAGIRPIITIAERRFPSPKRLS